MGDALTRLHDVLALDPATRDAFPRKQSVSFSKGKNLRQFLVRADLCRAYSQLGCSPCASLLCPLHSGLPYLEARTSISSTANLTTERIRGHYNCNTAHVVYVVTCRRCQLQGVGECASPIPRFRIYISDARAIAPTDTCAIGQHFQTPDHTTGDLLFTIVDAIPPPSIDDGVAGAVRTRMEDWWIKRLEPQLNDRRQWWHAFPGGPQR